MHQWLVHYNTCAEIAKTSSFSPSFIYSVVLVGWWFRYWRCMVSKAISAVMDVLSGGYYTHTIALYTAILLAQVLKTISITMYLKMLISRKESKNTREHISTLFGWYNSLCLYYIVTGQHFHKYI